MTLRERASVVLAELIGQGTPQSPAWLDHLEAFAQQVQEEERRAIVAMIQDNNGYPRKRSYSALNGWSFIIDDIRASATKEQG